MPLPFNFPYTRLLVALLLVALAVPAAFASTTVDAGDDFEPPLSISTTAASSSSGTSGATWSPPMSSPPSRSPGSSTMPSSAGPPSSPPWASSTSPSSTAPSSGSSPKAPIDRRTRLEPPEPKQPETPDEPEQPVDEPLTGPPDLVGIVFDREDYGDAFEGFLQDPDLTGELDAEQYGAEFETGGAVEARGFVAAVQQAFDAPDFADAALNTAGLAPEGEFITVFTTATRWTDSDAAALDVDSFADTSSTSTSSKSIA